VTRTAGAAAGISGRVVFAAFMGRDAHKSFRKNSDSPTGGTILDDFYQQKLKDNQAAELLNTIIHEGDHFTQPYGDPKQFDDQGTGHAYDEANKRTTPELIKEFNRRRKIDP
jgi:hypothetical protein